MRDEREEKVICSVTNSATALNVIPNSYPICQFSLHVYIRPFERISTCSLLYCHSLQEID
ncbi:unnamed protein product [Brassica oleracea var. botrytis]|uniref:(rape) hypothetical protein n=1 Tax=Brassica napus TaxID=3708 RepID=A0A816IM03_BRANA|nr:unnamed protein product [Brassica napus]